MAAERALPAGDRVVEDYAWASWPLWNVDPPVYRVFLTNLVNFPRQYNAETVAVSGNYLDVTYGEYWATAASDGCVGAACVRELDVPRSEAIKSRYAVVLVLAKTRESLKLQAGVASLLAGSLLCAALLAGSLLCASLLAGSLRSSIIASLHP